MLTYKAKRIIMDFITTSLIRHRSDLFESYKTNLTGVDHIKKTEIELLFSKINRDYYNSVGKAVMADVSRISSEVSQGLEQAKQNPSLCWKGDDFSSATFSADKVFALCFYALTRRAAPKRHLLAAKQLQSFSMQDTLREAYTEIGKHSRENSEA